jgi:hypothetical protein
MQLVLDEFQRNLQSVPIEKLPIFLAALAGMMAEVQMRMMMGQGSVKTPLPDAGRYLSVEEVAERFHVSKVWLYRHKRKLPHSQPSRKVLLFPERAISQWFANRKGA